MLKKLYNFFFQSWTGTIISVLIIIFFFMQAYMIPSGSMKNTLLVGDFLFGKKFSYGIPTPHIPWLELPVLPDFDKDGHLIKGEGPKRGDIVIFRDPNNPKTYFVKRCVAKAGDEVIYSKKTLYVRMAEGDEFMRQNYADDVVEIQGRLFVKEPYKQAGIHYDDRADIEPIIAEALRAGRFAMQPLYIEAFGDLELSGANAYGFKVGEDEYFMVGDNRDHSSDSRFWGAVPYKYIIGQPWFIYLSLDENKNVRWERVGRFVNTLENDERFIKHHESEINALE